MHSRIKVVKSAINYVYIINNLSHHVCYDGLKNVKTSTMYLHT